jgi:hypothetical protein
MDPRNNGHGQTDARSMWRGRATAIALAVVAVLALGLAARQLLVDRDDPPAAPSTSPVLTP